LLEFLSNYRISTIQNLKSKIQNQFYHAFCRKMLQMNF